MIIATWALRKRRNDRLHQDILDFSNANLVDHDPEKVVGAAEVGSSVGHGSGSSTGHGTVPPPVQPRNMYQDSYSTPIYAPKPPPSRNANPYGAQAAYEPPYGAAAYNGYQQNNTYNNYGYGYGNVGASHTGYDQAYGGMDDAYAGYAEAGAMAGIGAGAQQPSNPPQRRPSAQRKPPPALNLTPPANPIVQPVNAPSPVSLNNPPLQPSGAPLTLPDEFGATPSAAGRLMVSRVLVSTT